MWKGAETMIKTYPISDDLLKRIIHALNIGGRRELAVQVSSIYNYSPCTHTSLPAPGITADGVYVVTEEMLKKIEFENDGILLDTLRSRPHTPAPEQKLPVETCPICDIALSCEGTFGSYGYPPCVQRAAKVERKQVLDEIRDYRGRGWSNVSWMDRWYLEEEFLNNLRAHQEHPKEEP
jgi:hypothetical protein